MVRWWASCDVQGLILQQLQLTGIFTETSGPERADVYNSPCKGTVHLPCWINTLVMYCWLLLCGSPMIWEDVNEDCCFLCVLNWKDSGRHTPIRLLEPFGCLWTECPSTWHGVITLVSTIPSYFWIYTSDIVDFSPSLSLLSFDGWAVWFGFCMIWASGRNMQGHPWCKAAYSEGFFFSVLWCSELKTRCMPKHVSCLQRNWRHQSQKVSVFFSGEALCCCIPSKTCAVNRLVA
jgi:hypothetical protein